MKVLVTASRGHSPAGFNSLFREAVDRYVPTGTVTLIHGAARGGDELAAAEAERRGWSVYSFPAEWKRYGKGAGPVRNREMLDTMQPDLVLAFPLANSIGTWQCAKLAAERGIPTYVIRAGIEDVGPNPWR